MDYYINFILFSAAIIAVITDLKTGLIKNWLTLPLWALGLTLGFLENGLSGLCAAFGAGLLVVVTTFKFSTPGGGDIKLGLAVGSIIGVSGWIPYFIGSALTRVILSLAVKFKIYGPGLRDFYSGLKYECLTASMPALGNKNFKVFQAAALKAGANTDLPVVPGALWIAGGVLSYLIYNLL